MSILFLDSFDHYLVGLDKWDTHTGGGAVAGIHPIQTAGRFTPGALFVTGSGIGGISLTKSIAATSDFYMGFAYNDFEGNGDNNKVRIQGPVQALLSMVAATGIITVTYDGHTVATAPSVLTGTVWQFIEIHIFQHPTLGIIEIRRNGVSVASLTNVDTAGGDFTAVTVETSFQLERWYMDDLYILDGNGTVNNGFLGDTRITVLRPKANGLDNNFTPFGSGTNFGAVNETTQDDDATYVEAGQLGATEEYTQTTFTDLGLSPGTIFGVQVVNATKKTDAGQLKYKDLMVIGGIEFDKGLEIIATDGAYKMSTFVRDTDPSDDGTWTEAKVDAVGSGLTITFREV